MSYCVYKHTFPNGKVYIGITCRKPEYRWNNGKGYLAIKKDGKYKQPAIANAILKYGWENVTHEILFDCLTKEEAEQKEIKLISEYQSNKIDFGYNIANGGRTITFTEAMKKKASDAQKKRFSNKENHPLYGKHLSEEHKRKLSEAFKGEKNHNYGKHPSEESRRKMSRAKKGLLTVNHTSVRCVETGVVYKSAKEAQNKTGATSQGILLTIKGKQKTAGGYHWECVNSTTVKRKELSKKEREKYSKIKKPVRCIETGIVYESVTDAANATGIFGTSISKVCKGKGETTGGYHWEYVDENNIDKPPMQIEYKNKRCRSVRSVRCVETGIIYESVRCAANAVGSYDTNIAAACRGKRKTAKGYHWEYVEDTQ